MTFEELKEMIDSTINENGCGTITGKALNLALIETLTAIEEMLSKDEGSGSGSLPVILAEVLTEEQLAINVKTYNEAMKSLTDSSIAPSIVVDITPIYEAQGVQLNGEGRFFSPAIQVMVIKPGSVLESEIGGPGIAILLEGIQFTVGPDGTITMLS